MKANAINGKIYRRKKQKNFNKSWLTADQKHQSRTKNWSNRKAAKLKMKDQIAINHPSIKGIKVNCRILQTIIKTSIRIHKAQEIWEAGAMPRWHRRYVQLAHHFISISKTTFNKSKICTLNCHWLTVFTFFPKSGHSLSPRSKSRSTRKELTKTIKDIKKRWRDMLTSRKKEIRFSERESSKNRTEKHLWKWNRNWGISLSAKAQQLTKRMRQRSSQETFQRSHYQPTKYSHVIECK